MILASKREKLESFAQLQKARAENSANFVFFTFIFGSKIKEIRSKTLEKEVLRKKTMTHLNDFNF